MVESGLEVLESERVVQDLKQKSKQMRRRNQTTEHDTNIGVGNLSSLLHRRRGRDQGGAGKEGKNSELHGLGKVWDMWLY